MRKIVVSILIKMIQINLDDIFMNKYNVTEKRNIQKALNALRREVNK